MTSYIDEKMIRKVTFANDIMTLRFCQFVM